MSWYQTSYSWITEQELENTDMDREALRKHCSKNYPFSERKGWAYKSFLKAMKDKFGVKKQQDNQHDLLGGKL